MEWFDDFIFVIASEYKSTVFVEGLNVRSKKELYVGSGIVCFVDDNDFVTVSYTHLTLPTIVDV